MAIDSLVTQLKDRYSVEERHAQHLMLIPSVLGGNTKEIPEREIYLGR